MVGRTASLERRARPGSESPAGEEVVERSAGSGDRHSDLRRSGRPGPPGCTRDAAPVGLRAGRESSPTGAHAERLGRSARRSRRLGDALDVAINGVQGRFRAEVDSRTMRSVPPVQRSAFGFRARKRPALRRGSLRDTTLNGEGPIGGRGPAATPIDVPWLKRAGSTHGWERRCSRGGDRRMVPEASWTHALRMDLAACRTAHACPRWAVPASAQAVLELALRSVGRGRLRPRAPVSRGSRGPHPTGMCSSARDGISFGRPRRGPSSASLGISRIPPMVIGGFAAWSRRRMSSMRSGVGGPTVFGARPSVIRPQAGPSSSVHHTYGELQTGRSLGGGARTRVKVRRGGPRDARRSRSVGRPLTIEAGLTGRVLGGRRARGFGHHNFVFRASARAFALSRAQGY